MRDEAKLEKVQNIPLEDLQPFENHPYKVADDDEMKQMIESTTVHSSILLPKREVQKQ